MLHLLSIHENIESALAKIIFLMVDKKADQIKSRQKRGILTEKKTKNGEVQDPLAQSLTVQNNRTRKECMITSYNLVLAHR